MPAATSFSFLHRPSTSKSFSRNAADLHPIPPSRSRKQTRNSKSLPPGSPNIEMQTTTQLESGEEPGKNLNRVRDASPGEMIPTTGSQLSLNTDSVSGGGEEALADGEEYRDLSAADLIVVIDLQQQLLDQVNTDNKELTNKIHELRDIISQLDNENSRLRGLNDIRTANGNADLMLDNLRINANSSNIQLANAGMSVSDRQLLETLSSQLNTRQAELDLKEQMLKSVESELVASKVELANKTADLETKGTDSQLTKLSNVSQLEDTIQDLSNTIKKMSSREEDLSDELQVVRERLSKLTVQNQFLQDQILRKGNEFISERSEHCRDIKDLIEKQRAELKDTLQIEVQMRQIAEKHVEDLRKDLEDLNAKLTEQKLLWESEKSRSASALSLIETSKESAVESLQKVQLELTETKLQLSSVENRFAYQLQRDQNERDLFVKKWKLTEDRLVAIHERLREAELGWSAAGFQNIELTEKLAIVEREKNPENPPSTDQLLVTRMESLEKAIISSASSKSEFQSEVLSNLEILFDHQCRLTEKCLQECQKLTDHLETARQEHRGEFEALSLVNVDVIKKYEQTLEMNVRLIAECNRLQVILQN